MTRRELIERCERLEAHVRHQQLATAAELAEYRPPRWVWVAAGPGQPRKRRAVPIFRWVFYYAQLVRFCGRIESRETVGMEADAAILQALRCEPKSVPLGGDLVLEVHPKSFNALLNVHARDKLLHWLNVRYAALADAEHGAEALQFLERVAAEISYQYGLLAWTATADGPGLPFDPRADERPDVPPALRTLEPFQLFRLHQAFIEVNAARLQALERLVSPAAEEGPTARPTWSGFFSNLAMKWEVDPQVLMADHALVKLLAMVKLAAPQVAEKAAEEVA